MRRPLHLRRFLLPLAAVVLWLAGTAYAWHGAARWLQAGENTVAALGPASAADPARPPVLWVDNDTLVWLSLAREQAATGAWRTRHTQADNAPAGRPVHWSQSVTWLMRAAGAVYRWHAPEVVRDQAVERGAAWLGPALFSLLLAVSVAWLMTGAGALPATLAVVLLCTQWDVARAFHPLRPDHQMLHTLLAAATVAGVLGALGAARAAGRPAAARLTGCRRALLCSGGCAGAGLWVSATVLGPTLLALGAALALALRLARAEGRLPPARLWRLWGATAAATSLAFYLIEYAGTPLGWRLEVNHPLHALGALALGDALARWQRRERGLRLVVSAALALLPAGLIVAGPTHLHALRDPALRTLHEGITEFWSLARAEGAAWPVALYRRMGLLPLALPTAAWLTLRGGRGGPGAHPGLVVLAVLAGAFFALGCGQTRWLVLGAVFLIWLAALAVSPAGWLPAARVGAPPVFVAVSTWCLAWQAWCFAADQQRELAASQAAVPPHPHLARLFVQRELAREIGAARGGAPWRFLAAPDLAPALYYYAGIPGVMSYYWENRDGLGRALAILDSRDETEAHARARALGLTHVIVPRAHAFADEIERLAAAGAAAGPAGRPHRPSLIARLMREDAADLPPWLEPDPDLQPLAGRAFPPGGGEVVTKFLVYRIVPAWR